jgi:hypothetical protein
VDQHYLGNPLGKTTSKDEVESKWRITVSDERNEYWKPMRLPYITLLYLLILKGLSLRMFVGPLELPLELVW